MIPFDFSYYRPDTLQEAVQLYGQLAAQNKNPYYYGGGSEIITMSRVGSIAPGAVIDLKAIPECSHMELSGEKWVIGSMVTLSRIAESKLFPLLKTTVSRIADHTNQCRITIGGNICGTIIYREGVLPLLLCDAQVVIFGLNGSRTVPLHTVFDGRIKLNKGELIVRFIMEKAYLSEPFVHVKKTKNEKIDYPLLTLAAIVHGGLIRAAFSGLCDAPFRSAAIENVLNEKNLSPKQKAEKVITHLPASLLNNISGSDNYRAFVLKNTLLQTLERLEEPHGKV